ncbi:MULTISPECIES: hypothetical protein [unclassified Microcoleus]|uniref:hypothetical protein n=1 Tax=unclassified Microcoleus TaxID=2642155 RepID=UPI0025E1235C|nr:MULTISPECIES: hypothetical protein [unclassified Microcoleus]
MRWRVLYHLFLCDESKIDGRLINLENRKAGIFTRKNWLKARPRLTEKLKLDYSLLQSSDLRVEVALKSQKSTVNCQLSTVEARH